MSVTARPRPRRGHRPRALVVLLAVLVAACGGSSDPESELAGAFDATFDDSFAYRFVVDADEAALEGLGEGAGQAAAFLSGLAVQGTVDEDAVSADLQALGTSLLQVRSIGEDQVFLRVGVQDLIGLLGGGFAVEDVVPALQSLGFDEETQAVVLSLLQGDWLGIEGGFDPARLGAADEEVDEEEARAAAEEAFGGDLRGFFDRFVVVDGAPEEVDGAETYAVSLQLRELLRAASSVGEQLGTGDAMAADLEADLAELPETVPGDVTVADGVVTTIVFHAADTIRASGSELAGDLDLVLDLSDHGAVEPVVAPDGATVITGEELGRILEQLAALAGPLLGGGLEG